MKTTTKSNRFRNGIAAAFAGGALASSFAALPAIAEDSDVVEMNVKFGDLDISSPDGATKIFERIKIAAKSACQKLANSRIEFLPKKACIDHAILDAVTEVNNASLTAVYISTPDGATKLYERIETTAKSACQRLANSRIEFRPKKACVDHAILDAVTEANNASLTAVYSAKTGKEVSPRIASR